MSLKEKQVLVSTLSSILIFAFYSLYVYNNYIAANPLVINDFKFWGIAFIILIPVAIIAQIIIHIVFAIINKIVTNEDIPTISDEMDRLIELKAMRISYWTYTAGFLLAMSSQALNMPPYAMFLFLISSCLVSGTAEGIAKIYFYRKGI